MSDRAPWVIAVQADAVDAAEDLRLVQTANAHIEGYPGWRPDR